MFRSIWREIREVRVRAVVLLGAAVVLVYFDAGWLLAKSPSHSWHAVALGFAALCLAALYADGAAPADRMAGGPWPLSDRRRRFDALKVSLLIFAAVAICGATLAWYQNPDSGFQVSAPTEGGPIVVYRPTSAAEDAMILAGRIARWVFALVVALSALTAPASAALHGFHRTIPEIWVAWRRRFIPLLIATALAALALTPSAMLLQPVEALWSAVSDDHYWQYAFDLCIRAGPSNMGRYAAAATLLLGIVLWSYGRAIARLIERSRG